MYLYCSTNKCDCEIYKDHDEWFKERGKGIGGSDAACFIDANPWKTLNQLWHDKKYGAEQINSDAIEYGSNAEPLLRELFRLKHKDMDVQYEENCTFVSKDYPYMRYSPDGLILKENGERGILEIKTSLINNSSVLKKWGTKDNPMVPDNYFAQTLHGLNILDFDFVVYVAELRFADNESKIIERSYRKEEAIEQMKYLKENIVKKYNDYFIGDKEPPININL